jgi:hypothetical protein
MALLDQFSLWNAQQQPADPWANAYNATGGSTFGGINTLGDFAGMLNAPLYSQNTRFYGDVGSMLGGLPVEYSYTSGTEGSQDSQALPSRHFESGGQKYIADTLSGFSDANPNVYRVYRDLGEVPAADAYSHMPYDIYDASGSYLGSNQFPEIDHSSMRAGRTLMQAIAMAGAGAAAAGAGAAGGAGGAASGAGTGGALTGAQAGVATAAETAAMNSALQSSLAPYLAGGGAALSSSAGALESGLAPTSGGGWTTTTSPGSAWTGAGAASPGGGGSGFTFNPALDSQAANQAMGAEALSGYTGAPIPSVSIPGVGIGGTSGGGSWWDQLTGALTPSGGSGGSNLLGMGSTLLGGLSGAQGQQGSTSSTRQMDPRLDQPVYGAGGLVPLTQQALTSQFPQAQQYGSQLMSTGMGMVNSQIPSGPQNPYLSGVADDMQRRTQELLGENNLAIQGRAVGVGGLGGSRQGVAQGMAAGRAADSLQGQLAGLYGQAYQGDMDRQLRRVGLGSGLLSQGQSMQFQPLRDTASIYSPFTGFGTTTQNADIGGGWQGALGGLLGGAQFAKNMGWFGS